MTLKKQSKSDSRSYAEPRERGRPVQKDRSERNLRNDLNKTRNMNALLWVDEDPYSYDTEYDL